MNEIQACPEAERLAALAEGKVSDDERDRMLRHVNQCEDCYETLVDTMKFGAEAREAVVGAPLRFRRRERSWARIAGWAVAAVVLLAVLIPISKLPWRGDSTLGPAALAEALGTGRQPGELAAQLLPLDSGLGFGPRLDPRRTVFKLGVCWIDLEVARSAGEEIWTERILRELEKALEEIPRFSAQLEAVRQLRRDGAPSAGQTAALAATLGSVDEMDYFHLGVWAESGRLAGAAERDTLLRSPPFLEGMALARRLELPSAASAELVRIEGLAAEIPSGDAQWGALEKSFSDFIQLLM